MLLLALFGLLLAVAHSPAVSAAAPLSVGDTAPSFTLPDFSGRQFDLSTLIGQKTVLLVFLVPDSGGTLEDLDAVYPLYSSGAIEFVAVCSGHPYFGYSAGVRAVSPGFVTLWDESFSAYYSYRQPWAIIGLDGKIKRADVWTSRSLSQVCGYLDTVIGRPSESLEQGGQMPSTITVYKADGSPVNLTPDRGRALYIFYCDWDARNDFARSTLTYMDALYGEYQARGVDLVAVHKGSPSPVSFFGAPNASEKAKLWLDGAGLTMPVYWDQDRYFPRVLGDITNLIAVDSAGRVVETGGGRAFSWPAGAARRGLREHLDTLATGPAPSPAGDLPPVPPAVGENLPGFSLQDFENSLWSSSTLEGSPAVILFWNSHCGFALSVIARLRDLYVDYHARGVEFVTVNTFEDKSPARAWLQANPVPFITLRDEFGLVADRFGVWGTPTMVVVNGQGTVTFSGSGNDIHEADLTSILDSVAAPAGAGASGSTDPLRDLAPLVSSTGGFDGLQVHFDPLLGAESKATLEKGLRSALDSLYKTLGMTPDVWQAGEATLTFYADHMRYYTESGAPCSAGGYCVWTPGPPPRVNLSVVWNVDAETTVLVTRHELVHALLRLPTGIRPDSWFDEGLAYTVGGPRRVDWSDSVAFCSEPDPPGPDEISDDIKNGDQQEQLTANNVAATAVTYLIDTYDESGLQSVIDGIGSSGSVAAAIHSALGVSEAEFFDDFWAAVPEANRRAQAELPKLFEDVGALDYGAAEIGFLVDLGAINGFPDGKFLPEGLLTRAQFAKIAALTLALPPGEAIDSSWLDASEVPAWSLPYMAACLRDGIIQGSNNRIRPNDTISRAEAAIMIIRALDLTPRECPVVFSDRATIPSWASGYVCEAARQSIVDWGAGEAFDPSDPVDRLQAAIWLERAYRVKGVLGFAALPGI